MAMTTPHSHWGQATSFPQRPAGQVLESGFVPPAVDLRYPLNDWTTPGSVTMSPRGTTAVKDELTDQSDYSSEDTCSDYRDTAAGHPDLRSDPTERSRRNPDRRNDNDDSMTPEEAEKRRIRRERNKLAAARCRQRRVNLTNQLLQETETLEDERDRLQKEIQHLQRQRSQLEDLLGTHAPRCQSRQLVGSHHVMDIPPIKAEKCDDFFNMADTGLCRAPYNYSLPSTTFQSCSRPDSLPLSRRPGHQSSMTLLNLPNVTNSTSSNISGVANLGLDCMLDGHTGLTPITGAPSGCDHVARTPLDCGVNSGGYSPTTLMTL